MSKILKFPTDKENISKMAVTFVDYYKRELRAVGFAPDSDAEHLAVGCLIMAFRHWLADAQKELEK